MQAIAAPLSAKALPASAELCSGSLAMASMPPAARKFLHPGRARADARRDRRGRRGRRRGRLPVRVCVRVGSIAQALERLGQPAAAAAARTEVPPVTIGSTGAMRLDLDAIVAQQRKRRHAGQLHAAVGDVPGARLGNPRDLALDEPALQRARHAALGLDLLEQSPTPCWRVARSASRRTRSRARDRSRAPRALSSCSTRCVLRAMRRANASGLPSAQVKGSTVMASAPPNAAPAQATVVRSMFTHGSRRAIMRSEVVAVSCIFSAALAGPAGFRDACDEPARGRELGDGEEQVGIGAERQRRSARAPCAA